MEDVRAKYRRVFVDGSNTERLVFFSDAIFAIAMTLLVIDLKVPQGSTAWEVLVDQSQAFFAYVLSFTIIALNWMAHHRKFRVIKAHDGRLMMLDLVLLFFVAFVPFPTSLLSEYGAQPAAVVLYAFVVGLLSILQYLVWSYAWRHGFVDKSVDLELYRFNRRNQFTTPLVFWLSIPIALFIDAQAAMYFWFALFFVNIGLRIYDRARVSRSRDSVSEAAS